MKICYDIIMKDFWRWRKRDIFSQLFRFPKRDFSKQSESGFSLIEILVVIAILAIVMLVALFAYQRHLMRSRDMQRKTDLDSLRTAFEEYYNDHRCYPPMECVVLCGSNCLSPYLKSIPCDPLTHESYLYQSALGDYCDGYRLLAKLEITDDQDILGVGCNPEAKVGCDEDYPGYNWGVAVGMQLGDDGWQTGEETPANWNYCLPYPGGSSPYHKCQSVEGLQLQDTFQCYQGFETGDECMAACDHVESPAPGVVCDCREGATDPRCE